MRRLRRHRDREPGERSAMSMMCGAMGGADLTPRSARKARPRGVRERLAAIARGQAALVRSLALRIGSRADAQDLVQSALLRALERAEDLRDQDKLVPWFGRILRTSLADDRRRRAAESRMRSRLGRDAEEPGPSPDLRWLTCRCLAAALTTVRPEHADLLRRVELEGTPLRQVARELGVRPNTAAVRLHRGRRALVHALRQLCRFCRLHWRFDCSCSSPIEPATGASCEGVSGRP